MESNQLLKIHRSHSKDDLILMNEIFELNIDNIYNHSKVHLQKVIWSKINQLKEILPETKYFGVNNKKELINFLENPNPNKNLTTKEKSKVLTIARSILIYCRDGYYEVRPHFLDMNHLISSAEYISQYGDVSTVRKAIKALNHDSRINPKINIKMSKKTEAQMDIRKKQLKKSVIHPYLKSGKFVIIFE